MEVIELLRMVITLPLILFIPGYTWTRVFFSEDDIDWLERVVLSTGLSIAIVPLVFLLLNRAGMPITEVNSFITVGVIIILPLLIERVIKR